MICLHAPFFFLHTTGFGFCKVDGGAFEEMVVFWAEDEDDWSEVAAFLVSTLVDVLHLFFGGLDTPRPDSSCLWRAYTGD